MIEIDSTTSDAALLRRFVELRSPEAFGELAGRYLPLIYSSAVRQVRDRDLAEDVAQATLIVLARKAGDINAGLLAGWVIKTTHYTSRNALRERARRTAHEQRAAAMKNESHTPDDVAESEAVSREIDSALARLREVDRAVVVLRFFQNKSFAEIAAQLKTTESAAQRRIARAVEKLRKMLVARGASFAPAALPALLAGQVLHPAPESLVRSAGSITSVNSTSASFIAKGALYTMATAKIKIAVTVAAAVLIAGITAPAVYHFSTKPNDAAVTLAAPVTSIDFSQPVSGSLPPGMSAEPVGIMNLSDHQWMTPNGQPLATLPIDVDRMLSHLHVAQATHVFLFKAVPPSGAESWSYSLKGAASHGSTGTFDPKTKANYGLIVLAPTPGLPSLTLSITVATGAWTNCAIIPATAQSAVRATFDGASLVFDPPTQDKNIVQIKRHGSDGPSQTCTTFYGLDTTGKKINSSGMNSDGRTSNYRFEGPLSKYKEFRFDTRPYNYRATYAPVPLIPGK